MRGYHTLATLDGANAAIMVYIWCGEKKALAVLLRIGTGAVTNWNYMTTTQKRDPRTAQAHSSTGYPAFLLPLALRAVAHSSPVWAPAPAPAYETRTRMVRVESGCRLSECRCYVGNVNRSAGWTREKSPRMGPRAWDQMVG